MTSRPFFAVSLTLLTLGLVSCASVSVQRGTETLTPTPPKTVCVDDFDASPKAFHVDREGKEEQEFRRDLQVMLRVAMVKDMTKRLVPAFANSARKVDSSNEAWLVRGKFTLVNQGSRLLRGVVGFGSGGTKVETEVEVYDLSQATQTPFLTFTTTGGSGAEPGAILSWTTNPLEIAIGGVSGVAHGLTEDTARTAREITATLSDYMYRAGWISSDKRIEPKHKSADFSL